MALKKICIVGSGYVGMSIAVLLSKLNQVLVYDIDPSRIDKINKKKSTIQDAEIDHYLETKKLNISATLNKTKAYSSCNTIVIATPTSYDEKLNSFDTSSVDQVIDDIMNINPHALVVIKSTIPLGYTNKMQEKYSTKNIIFSPEFLREGRALKDNLYPSRIIVGNESDSSEYFAGLLKNSANTNNIEMLLMPSSEAEAVKLFANTYLAMRVAFFNELDTYALYNNLDVKSIIDGVSLDTRIGDSYNNPSFGYGGYCLPKDTKQLASNFSDIPNSLIEAIVSSNDIRKKVIAKTIINLRPKIVGIYRLVMKEGSDNFRSSAIEDIIKILVKNSIDVIIYEPRYKDKNYYGCNVFNSLNDFKNKSTLIVANRINDELVSVKDKVFTRDLFGRD